MFSSCLRACYECHDWTHFDGVCTVIKSSLARGAKNCVTELHDMRQMCVMLLCILVVRWVHHLGECIRRVLGPWPKSALGALKKIDTEWRGSIDHASCCLHALASELKKIDGRA